MLAPNKDAEDRARVGKFYRSSVDQSTTDGERANAKAQLDKLLAKLGLTMADAERIAKEDETDEDEPVTPQEMLIAVMDLLREYVWHPDERIYLVVALWILHTHCYRQFRHTPRLIVYAPLSNSGKSTLKTMAKFLSAGGEKLDGATSASLFRDIDKGIRETGRYSKFLDEMDNAEFDRVFHRIYNDGWLQGGHVSRVIGGETKRFDVFAPLCFGSINKHDFTPQNLSRSFLVKLLRKGTMELDKQIVNEEVPSEDILDVCYLIEQWVSSVGGNSHFDGKLNRLPMIPPTLFDRDKDRWRPLLSVADACGYGDEARAVATSPTFTPLQTDLKVLLAQDLRKVFDGLKAPHPRDHIWSETAAQMLREIHEAPWGGEWCGADDKGRPHPITDRELSRFLRKQWEVQSKSVRIADVTKKGWDRSQFELMWLEVGLAPATTAVSTERRHPKRRPARQERSQGSEPQDPQP